MLDHELEAISRANDGTLTYAGGHFLICTPDLNRSSGVNMAISQMKPIPTNVFIVHPGAIWHTEVTALLAQNSKRY